MINAQTIRKAAFLVAVTSFIFTIVAAIINYLYLDMSVIGAPLNFFAYSVLIVVLPYLFIGVIALIVTLLAKDSAPSQQTLPPQENEQP